MEQTREMHATTRVATRTNGRTPRNGHSPATQRAGARAGNGDASRKVRVAIVGVGNCASSLVQGRYFYEDAKPEDVVPGLMHVDLGGYHIRDIEFVAAFDIAKNKVGKDLSEAIYAEPNNTYVFHRVPHLGVPVERGMTHDGLGKYLSDVIEKAPGPTADIVGILRERKVDVVVSYLPVGSEEATKWYVEQCLRAGVGFVNAIPVFIGREPYWQRRFAEAGVPIIGDDIKSQVGATISHRVLTRLFMDRGVRLDRTYQLNFGGNTDFLNMLERERLESKKISKTNAVTSMLDYEMSPDDVHVGPSDYVPWLKDRKWCYIRMEGTTFGDVPLNLELKLEVWDSPNSAGVIIDAVRCVKLGLNRGLAGTLVAPSSYFMKSPPRQIPDEDARELVEAFIRGDDASVLLGTEAPDSSRRRTSSRERGGRAGSPVSSPTASASVARSAGRRSPSGTRSVRARTKAGAAR
jgi:myo-inositol-1-phosphate synthase